MGRSLDDLGTEALSWLDLRALVAWSPRSSALYRSMQPQASEWQTTDYLLALIADLLAASNWQRGGGKGARPKPLPRPQERGSGGATVLTLDAMDELLGYSPRH